MEFNVSVGNVYPITLDLATELKSQLDRVPRHGLFGIDSVAVASVIQNYMGEVEHSGLEGFRDGITLEDISSILLDFFLHSSYREAKFELTMEHKKAIFKACRKTVITELTGDPMYQALREAENLDHVHLAGVPGFEGKDEDPKDMSEEEEEEWNETLEEAREAVDDVISDFETKLYDFMKTVEPS